MKLAPLPMKEAQEFWRNKVKLSPGQHDKLRDDAKVKAFAVSGIAKGNELDTVFNAMQKAIDKGTAFDEFKTDCKTIFEKRGWTGKRAWRVDNIFRTNIQTAYNVGRYKQMMAVKDSRPFWMYDAVNDKRTRPAHLAMDGKIFPAGHPFWDKWYPPNGFRCRCGVDTLSQSEIDRDGLKVETEDPTGKLIEPIDPATGQKLPARLLMPDPGFAHNPGKTHFGWAREAKGGKFSDLPNLKKASEYGHRELANVRPADVPDMKAAPLASGMGDEVYASEFKKLYGEETVIKDLVGEPVILSLRSFLIDKTPGTEPVYKFDKTGHGESIPLIKEMVEQPFEIWLAPQKNDLTGQIRLTKRYISLWKMEDKQRIGGLMVFEVVDGEFQGVTSFLPLDKKGYPDLEYIEKQRKGLLLNKK